MDNKISSESGVPSIAEQVRLRLRADIYSMVLKPGQPIIEAEIARRFKISRTPVREAIKGLEAEGLIVSYPGRGSQVSEISMRDQLEALEVRELLEPYMARKAAANFTDSIGVQIQELLHELEAGPDQPSEMADRIDFDFKIHDLIWRACGNDVMHSIMLSMYYRVKRTYPLLKRYKITKDEHRLILESVQNQDEEQAEALMREHVRGLRLEFVRIF